MKTTFAKRVVRLISCVVSVMLIGFLISCSADLGNFEMKDGYKDYYEAFGDVIGKYDDNKTVAEISYNVEKSLFNDSVVNNLKWENDDDKVLYKEYCYIVIPFECEMKIESVALYVAKDSSSPSNNLEFSAFYFRDSSEVPTNIKLLTSDDTRIVEKDDGNGNMIQVEEEIEYDDPSKEVRNSSARINVTNSFDGFILDNFTQVNDGKEAYVKNKCICTSAGSFLYIRVENNSGLNKTTMKPCSFSFMNLLVRVV